MNLKRSIGILKSRITYDHKPFNRRKRKRFYGRFAREGSLCFDLGAHTGNRSSTWLSLKAKVVAVEPQPVFAAIIRKKLSGNAGFTLIEKAVSDREGKAMLRLSYSNPAVSTISETWATVISEFDDRTTWDEEIETEVTTLDALIGKYGIPDFCKIDVEGHEEEVLKGCSAALPALSFEFFPTTMDRAVTCIDLLEKKAGYTYNLSFVETFTFASETWMTGDEMKQVLRDYRGRKSGDVYAVAHSPRVSGSRPAYNS